MVSERRYVLFMKPLPLLRDRLLPTLIALVSCTAVGCPFIGSTTFSIIEPPFELVAEGVSIVAFQAVTQFSKEIAEKDRTAEQARVRAVIDKLVAGSPELKKEAAGWRILVLDSKDLDAAAFPGAGFVVNRGLLECGEQCLGIAAPPKRATKKKKKPTPKELKEAEAAKLRAEEARERVLAVSLSHEISHLQNRHFELRLRANYKAAEKAIKAVRSTLEAKAKSGSLPTSPNDLKSALASIKLDPKTLHTLISTVGFTIATEAIGHPFHEAQEYDSDCVGARLMHTARYDPKDALIFWSSNHSDKERRVFTLHPSSKERAARIERCIQALPNEAPRVASRH
jgi:predicted Zn-dependent protease